MRKDVRNEQLALLRFEKQIAGLAGVLAAGAATQASASDKLGGDAASDAYASIQAALVNLAEVTTKAHEALNAQADAIGAKTLNITGGVPKQPPADVVRLILGLG